MDWAFSVEGMRAIGFMVGVFFFFSVFFLLMKSLHEVYKAARHETEDSEGYLDGIPGRGWPIIDEDIKWDPEDRDTKFLDALITLRYELSNYEGDDWPLPESDADAESDQWIAQMMMEKGLL